MLDLGQIFRDARRSKRKFRLCLVFLLSALAVRAADSQSRNASSENELAVTAGALPNGLRYEIISNEKGESQLSLRLVVLAGLREEREDQKGYAHFVRHMAFSGSTHYAPGTLLEYFQRLGMKPGRDIVSETAEDHTVFKIELPQSAYLSEGLEALADIAGGLLIEPGQVDKQRAIVLGEKRISDLLRSFASWHINPDVFSKEFSSLQSPSYGLTSVIEEANRESLTEFYNSWYRPSRMMIVVAGTTHPTDARQLVSHLFADIQERATAPKGLAYAAPPRPSGVTAVFLEATGVLATKVSIVGLRSPSATDNHTDLRVADLEKRIALKILEQRLAKRAEDPAAPFADANIRQNVGSAEYESTALELRCEAAQWPAALSLAAQEIRRAIEFGFDQQEVEWATSAELSKRESQITTESMRAPSNLADRAVTLFVKKGFLIAPSEERALLSRAAKTTTPETCRSWIEKLWPENCIVCVRSEIANAGLSTGDPNQAVRAVYDRSFSAKLERPPPPRPVAFAYGGPNRENKPIDIKHDAFSGVELLRFANGVKFNFKHSDFETDTIRINIRFGSGRLSEPPDKPGLALLTEPFFLNGGLGKHSMANIRELIANKAVDLSFHVKDGSFVLGGVSNGKDLLFQLQLLKAYLEDPGFRLEGWRSAKANLKETVDAEAHLAEGTLNTDVVFHLASGDPRFGGPAKKFVLGLNSEDVRAWLLPQITQSAIEVDIIGDVSLDEALTAVGPTFGNLPKRTSLAAGAEARHVSFPETPFDLNYRILSPLPQAVVALYWPVSETADIGKTERLKLLADILFDRLNQQIVNGVGGALNPEVRLVNRNEFENHVYISAKIVVDPTRVSELSDLMINVVADLQHDGVTADQLERAKRPRLVGIKAASKSNAKWLEEVLNNPQERPERLKTFETRYRETESTKKSEIDDLARLYLSPEKAFRAVVIGQPQGTPSL